MQQRQTSGGDHAPKTSGFSGMVLLDPALLADLHRAGWRGAVSSDAAFLLGIAEPVRPDRYGPRTRAALESALTLPTLQHLPLPDVTSLSELRSFEKSLSYEERILLAVVHGGGHRVAVQNKPLLQHAEKFLGKARVLSREALIASAGLRFEAVSLPTPTPLAAHEPEMAALWKLWGDVGRTATERARAEMHAQGIGFIYKRDGIVVEELPDGTVRPVHAVRPFPALPESN